MGSDMILMASLYLKYMYINFVKYCIKHLSFKDILNKYWSFIIKYTLLFTCWIFSIIDFQSIWHIIMFRELYIYALIICYSICVYDLEYPVLLRLPTT